MSWSQRDLQAIFQKSGGQCGVCGAPHQMGGYPRYWEVDHIYPVSRGGSYSIDNLSVCCVACNRDKSDRVHIMDAAFHGFGR